VIDTAKAVNVLISEGAEDLMQLLGTKLRKPMQPFLAVPTTSGTGSEVTYAAMIMNADQNMKIPLFSYLLFPKTAILDPRMTLSLPPKVTASSAMDALTHAIEAFICTSKNPFSDAHSLAAIRLIRENLFRVIRDGNDGAGRFQLANAACLAGAAFSNSGVGLVHALGHALGAVCRVPHGVAMNIFLPHGLEYNLKAVGGFIGELLLPLAGPEEYVQTPRDERPQKTVETIHKFRDQLYRLTKLARTLKEARVARKRMEEVADKAIRDPAAQFNPVRIQRKDMLELLNRAYE
jgi:alcohol dehydrogenase